MVWHMRCLLTAAGIVAAGALQQRLGNDDTGVAEEELAYVSMVQKVCLLPSFKGSNSKLLHWLEEGDWTMKVYNGNNKMTSALWQHQTDGRCVLAFSGYHGHITGYLPASQDLTTPKQTWKVCGNEIYAPWVKLLRQHTRLDNWTHIANFLGGNESTCKGELLVAGESAGGPVAETLAACVNGEKMYDALPKDTPPFNVHALYTFGAPPTAKKPIVNPRHPSGCFRGKRVFNTNDNIAFFMGVKELVHPMYDSVEIWEKEQGPTFKVTPCLSQKHSPTTTEHGLPGPALVTHLKWKSRSDISHHEIMTYGNSLRFFSEAGYGQFVSADLVDPGSSAWVEALKTRDVDRSK